jgi:hypothetical protein
MTTAPVLRPARHTLTSSPGRRNGAVGEPPPRPRWPPLIPSGDVLVSRPTARADAYAVGVVGAAGGTGSARYEDALDTGRELARERAVDGWFTCDHTHFLRIARHRS